MSASRVVELWQRDTVHSDEWRWAQFQCADTLRRQLGDAVRVCPRSAGHRVTVAEVLQAAGNVELVGVLVDDVSLWAAASWSVLFHVLESDGTIGVAGPGTNHTTVSAQRVTPAFSYSTPSLFERAASEAGRSRRGERRRLTEIDPFGFAVRRADLAALDGELAVEEAPAVLAAAGRALMVALDAYVHRWPDMYGQARPDLRAHLPPQARRVLDVGCASGRFGASLKDGWDGEVVGIEVDPELAGLAAGRIDRVVTADLDHTPPDLFGADFDAIFCGDVLEHLRDPWRTVGVLATWLRPRGRLIATMPNAGHWAIIADLLRGHFDYVPFGLLCWGHLRFFTPETARQLFETNGLTVHELAETDPDHSPPADEFIKSLRRLRRDISVDRLRARVITIVGGKDG